MTMLSDQAIADDEYWRRYHQELVADLEEHFRETGRADWRADALRVVDATRNSAADPLLFNLDGVDIAARVAPILARWAPDASQSQINGAARELQQEIENLADIANVDFLIDAFPRPRRGSKDYDLLTAAIAIWISRMYWQLTRRRPARSSYRAKGRIYGFQAFLGEIFDALGIEASAEHYTRVVRRWIHGAKR